MLRPRRSLGPIQDFATKRLPLGRAWACAIRKPRSCRSGSGSIEHRRLAQFDRATFGEWNIESRTFTQKYILPGQTVSLSELVPFVDGNDNRGVDSPTGHDLWSLLERVIDQFTEARLGFL